MTVVRPVSSERETWIDVAKGMCTGLVVLSHVGLGLTHFADSTPVVIEAFGEATLPFRMSLMMFLSGLFLGRNLAKGTRTFVRGRIRSIAWPYLLWCVLTLVPVGDLTPSNAYTIVTGPPETHLWFLWFLIIFALVAPFLRRLPIAMTFFALAIGAGFLPDDYRLSKLAAMLAFYLLGDWVGRHRERVRVSLTKPLLITAALVAVGVGALSAAGVEVDHRPVGSMGALAVVALVVGVLPFVDSSRWPFLIRFIGANSMIFFLVHVPVVKVTAALLSHIGLTEPWPMYGIVLGVTLGACTTFVFAARRMATVRALVVMPNSWLPQIRSRAMVREL